MLISELDLYKSEWLELVFANRNKHYGAYQLRRENNNVINRALGVVLAFTLCASGIITYASHNRAAKPEQPVFEVVDVTVTKEPPVIEHPKKAEPKNETKQTEPVKPLKAAAPSPAVPTQQYIEMKAVKDEFADKDIKELDKNMAVGQKDEKGDPKAMQQNVDDSGKGTGTGEGNGVDNEVHGSFEPLEFMPQPVGGDAAWAKFLQKNLRYPALARENEQSGKVFISFIVERDGRLSDISILRKAGFGFDEEALRVLKLAPAWKPGIQNGAAVRVRFTIPINFQIASE